jgi:hypothetical protein
MSPIASIDFSGAVESRQPHTDTPSLSVATPEISTAGVVEMLLKDHARLNRLLRDEARQRELLPRMLAVAVAGFAVYGIVVTAIFNALRSQTGFWFPHLPAAYWSELSAANLALAYTLGLIAANGICLPSFYFYGLLAGIRTTMLGVAAHAIKGMAAGAVALVGFLPVYVAIALTSVVFPAGVHWQLPTVAAGLALPFLAGIVGAANLYEGFVGLADTMTGPGCRSRECFLRRLILAWCGCASFVTPVVIYTLWHFLSDLTAHAGFGS